MPQAEETPGPNEMYCPECGEITPREGIICGHCASPLNGGRGSSIPPAKLEGWGKTAAGFAYFLTPVIFAPIAFWCGHRLRRFDEEAGMRIIGYAVGSVFIWVFLLALVL